MARTAGAIAGFGAAARQRGGHARRRATGPAHRPGGTWTVAAGLRARHTVTASGSDVTSERPAQQPASATCRESIRTGTAWTILVNSLALSAATAELGALQGELRPPSSVISGSFVDRHLAPPAHSGQLCLLENWP